MEYCGATLKQKIESPAKYSAKDVFSWLLQCIEALSNPLIQFHGDINICVLNKRIKIIDFGRTFVKKTALVCTANQYTKGYMAPEVIEASVYGRQGKIMKLAEPQKVDVYSLGITFLEVVCRKTEKERENFMRDSARNYNLHFDFEYNKFKIDLTNSERELLFLYQCSCKITENVHLYLKCGK